MWLVFSCWTSSESELIDASLEHCRVEGPHWIFMVCPRPAIKDKVVFQMWSRTISESANSESCSDHDNCTDIVDWSQSWTSYFSDRRAPSPAHK